MIEKKNWEKILKDNEDNLEKMTDQFYLTKPQFERMIVLAKEKISELPEDKTEEDPMPKEVKDVILGVA